VLSVDSPYSHRGWAKDLGGVPFPMLSDWKREFARAYHILQPGSRFINDTTMPAAFVIDAEGIVRYAWYRGEGTGRPPLDEILEAVRQIGAQA
jgi:alkyl hydroperoxide reductase subunit AhpC